VLSGVVDQFGLLALAFAVGAMFAAGFVKGAVGFALPTIAISGVGSVLSAPLAIAAMIAPSLVTNLWQVLRQGIGPAMAAVREFWLLNMVLFATIAATAQLVVMLSEQALFLILGVAVTGFALAQLSGWKPPRPKRHRRAVEVGVGLLSGFFGGLAGVWGPPILLYLHALDASKRAQVRALGLSFFGGSVMLTAAHARSGLLSGEALTLTLAMIPPTLLGMAAGLMVQDRLDQRTFRRWTLAVLALAGLNLLRRGVFG
jgi:uncharacterized membrane protein YfcA